MTNKQKTLWRVAVRAPNCITEKPEIGEGKNSKRGKKVDTRTTEVEHKRKR